MQQHKGNKATKSPRSEPHDVSTGRFGTAVSSDTRTHTPYMMFPRKLSFGDHEPRGEQKKSRVSEVLREQKKTKKLSRSTDQKRAPFVLFIRPCSFGLSYGLPRHKNNTRTQREGARSKIYRRRAAGHFVWPLVFLKKRSSNPTRTHTHLLVLFFSSHFF